MVAKPAQLRRPSKPTYRLDFLILNCKRRPLFEVYQVRVSLKEAEKEFQTGMVLGKKLNVKVLCLNFLEWFAPLLLSRIASSFSNTFIRTLRKHAYSNILKILPPKTESFQIKVLSDIFQISAQKIHCRYSLEPPHQGGSNEYSQSMFLSRNKKTNVYPCKPQFYYIKVGFKGVKII